MRHVVDLDRTHPFDPPEAAPFGHDQTRRKAVPCVECVATDPCGEQKRVRSIDWEAAIVARDRYHTDGRAGRFFDQAIQPRTGPLLGREETAGAVQCRRQSVVECKELVI